MLSRILGAGMTLLFFLRILVNKASRVKAAGHFNKFFVVSCSFLGFHRHIISTLQGIRVCDYLFSSSIPMRFIIVGCCSISLIRIGGELNDFNK